MSAVREVLSDVQYSTRCVEKCEEDLKAARATLAERTKKLQDLLAAGGTTGDRLRDLVIRNDGVDEESLSLYRGLESRLKGRAGEFVLIRYSVKVRQRFGGDIHESDFAHQIYFRIAQLSGEELRLETYFVDFSCIGLPIGKYLTGVWPRSSVYVPVVEGEAQEGSLFSWSDADDTPPQLIEYLKEVPFKEDLLIGDDAIKRALAKVRSEDFFAKAAERLGRLILQPIS
jgi:hypothetical protein